MKADNLRRMRDQGLPVPPFTVVTQSAPLRLDFSEAERFAVRSTFDQEDSAPRPRDSASAAAGGL